MGLYIRSMKMHLSPAVLAAAVISFPAFAQDAPVKPAVALDYKIYIGGLEALSATATIGADAAHYDIEIKAVTAGAIGRMMPWTVNIGSRGNVSGETLQPIEHAQTNNFQGKDRSVVLRYDGHGGFIDRKVMPDAQEDQRDEVPADMTRDTLDIVSGVMAGLRAVDRTASCTSRVPVFDGRRRFDLVYSDDGHETLESSGVAIYSGDALKCAVKVEPVAGFWRKNQKKFFSRKVNGEDQVVPIEVYIARVGAAKVEVPVRIESTSPFGPLVLNLQGVHDPQ
jgi:hypothetical protein